MLRFTTDLRIPPTSNQAERDLQPAKTQQKISGRLRSGETTRHRYAIRGYISAAKHRASVLTALRDALLGQPWTPPIPGRHKPGPGTVPARTPGSGVRTVDLLLARGEH